jgi:FKBP-type peptidyl-prolyl cis-trans isomerase FkpA
MKVGGKARLVCPAHLAYGKEGVLARVPPNEPLVFEVELGAIVQPSLLPPGVSLPDGGTAPPSVDAGS